MDKNSVRDLSRSTDASEMLRSHEAVVSWYAPYMTERLNNYDAVAGNIWTAKEKADAKSREKILVTYNTIKPHERTILGHFIRSAWDVKFTPVEESDNNLASALEHLRIHENQVQDILRKDVDVFRNSWAAGSANQECVPRLRVGERASIRSTNLNDFNVYWDPASRIPVTREDARFVDVDSWATLDELKEAYPDMEEELENALGSDADASEGMSFENITVYGDDSAKNKYRQDGRFRVTERYYRARRKTYQAYDGQNWVDLTSEEATLARQQGMRVVHDWKEFLFLACICPAYSTTKFLFNGKFYTQPRTPRGDLMWPILEMVAESLNGQPMGFVQHEREPNKAYSALMCNILESAKHAASQGMFADPAAFSSDKDFRDFTKFRADANRVYKMKPGRVSDAASPIPHTSVTYDTYEGMRLTQEHTDKVSSAPPALSGIKKGETSGALNAQLIEQGENQLQVLMLNYRTFLRQRYWLWMSYWREHYEDEFMVRLLEPKESEGEQEQEQGGEIVFNLRMQDLDTYGFPVPGKFRILNDLSQALFDVMLEESTRSSSYRIKVQSQVSDLMQSNAAAQDPVIAGLLLQAYVELSDIPDQIKSAVRSHNQVIQSRSQQAQEAQQREAQIAEQERMVKIEKDAATVEKTSAEADLTRARTGKEDAETQYIGQDSQEKAVETERAKLGLIADRLVLRQKNLELVSVKQGIADEEVRPELEFMPKPESLSQDEKRRGVTRKSERDYGGMR